MSNKKNIITYSSPEAVGVSSESIEQFIRTMEDNRLATHSIIIARGNQIIYENYWAPFHRDYLHRIYSSSKSFVSLAIGFLVQDGLIDLNDPISKYFPEELKDQPDQNVHKQTVLNMLMMSTARRPIKPWFTSNTEDRVNYYLQAQSAQTRPAGLLFEYDSNGSFLLGVLVERVTGKPFMEYLREKLFKKIGVSDDAYCLKCPGGHSWGDSAILCTAMDLFLTARFTLNGGSWDGEQLLDPEYVKAATSKQIDNSIMASNPFDSFGYGYQFWMTYQNAYFFNGMGCQIAVCVPDKDLILVCNADNQGKNYAMQMIIEQFFDCIANHASAPLPENPSAFDNLQTYSKNLILLTAQGFAHSDYEKLINRVTFQMQDNVMGITKLRLEFAGEQGRLCYTNLQGDKELPFGLGHNSFGLFPQEGYSDEIGSIPAKGNYYQCAASAGWIENNKLRIFVQIIDRYFGNIIMTLAFRDGTIALQMQKAAEFFLEEYNGFAYGNAE